MIELGAATVVIGSGAGGAPVACRLAEAGQDVLLLEEGGDYRKIGVNGEARISCLKKAPSIEGLRLILTSTYQLTNRVIHRIIFHIRHYSPRCQAF